MVRRKSGADVVFARVESKISCASRSDIAFIAGVLVFISDINAIKLPFASSHSFTLFATFYMRLASPFSSSIRFWVAPCQLACLRCETYWGMVENQPLEAWVRLEKWENHFFS
jgi:hypothetical protein